MNVYVKRAFKYFLYLMVIFALIIIIMMVTGTAENQFTSMRELFLSERFVILFGVMIVFSGLYPKFGYVNRRISKINNRERMESDFKQMGIVKIKEVGNVVYYRYESFSKRLITKFDDTFTIEFGNNYSILDGTKVMISRAWSPIEFATRD